MRRRRQHDKPAFPAPHLRLKRAYNGQRLTMVRGSLPIGFDPAERAKQKPLSTIDQRELPRASNRGNWFSHDPRRWPQFQRHYRIEL
ncbi:MAG: hypothetical protein KGM47_15620, partial [Acidobacteriota bacterium]|nr:hypothetical protein [Acidobacteriota bacterium]